VIVDFVLSQIVCPLGSCSLQHPLQNKLKELFPLPNFIRPEIIFVDYAGFDIFLPKDMDSTQIEEEKSKNVVEVLHNSPHEITKTDP
jgi:SNF2 family DNA or RNA helicase